MIFDPLNFFLEIWKNKVKRDRGNNDSKRLKSLVNFFHQIIITARSESFLVASKSPKVFTLLV